VKFPDPFNDPNDPFNTVDRTSENLMDWPRSQPELQKPEPETPRLLDGCYLQPSGRAGIWRLYVPAGSFSYQIFEGTKADMISVASSLVTE
jgi:hypothetical protein